MAYGMDDEGQTRTIGLARIGTGLVQGVALWALTEAADNQVWPATNGVLFGVLAAVVLFTPFVVLGGLADMRRRTLVVWTLAAAAGLAALGAHDIDRRAAHEVVEWISGQAMVFLAAVLFITHHLVSAADSDRKLIARFPTYFDQAWKHGVQLVMSAGFVGVFWLVLFLGAALFKLIGIEFVEELTRKSWFAIPATTTMFAAAVQLTDVRHGLIRGIRTVALTLLSWLLPVLVFLTGAFMLALPFTGLEPLWKTRSAAAILLSAAAVMIVLINAAYQDGEPDTPTPFILRWAGRIGGLLLLPLVGVAAYALGLRIGQYGLTPDRIIAAACVVAGVFYAVGYSLAAVLPGVWMKRLETANVVTAVVTVGLILALFSPLADPARLSVDSQMARIADGRLKPDKVDYRFLRFQSERYGVAALQTLKKEGGEVGKRATEALAWESEREAEGPPAETVNLTQAIKVWPAGAVLPVDFLTMAAADKARLQADCGTENADINGACNAILADVDGDGANEVLVIQAGDADVFAKGPAEWSKVGAFVPTGCAGYPEALREGRSKLVPSRPWRDLEINGERVPMQETYRNCAERKAPAPR